MQQRLSSLVAVLALVLACGTAVGGARRESPQDPRVSRMPIEGPYRAVLTKFIRHRTRWRWKREETAADFPELSAVLNKLWRDGYDPMQIQALPDVSENPQLGYRQYLVVGRVR